MVRAELPGLNPEDVKLEITDDAIVLEGERKEQREENKGGVPAQGSKACGQRGVKKQPAGMRIRFGTSPAMVVRTPAHCNLRARLEILSVQDHPQRCHRPGLPSRG